ncbi:MAG: hypothetical protein EZS28_024040, partial [Streblomastix strix]
MKGPECLDEFYSQDMPSILNKFLSPKTSNEKFVLSTTILHIAGVLDNISDEIVRANAAIEPLLQMIHSPNEGRSRAASKALGELAEDNDLICASLLSTGFLGSVQHTLSADIIDQVETSQQLKLSESYLKQSKEEGDSAHIKDGLLDVVLRIMHSSDNDEELKQIAVLIPALEELKSKGSRRIRRRAKDILSLLGSEGITSVLSSKKEKENELKIRELEELNRKQEELNRKQEEELRQVKELNEKQKVEIAQQKVEIEKWKPKLPQDIAFTTTSVDPADFVISAQGNGQIKIAKQQNKYNNISFGPVLENGIYAVEASFQYSGHGAGIGIVRDTYSIPDNCAPWSVGTAS